MARGVAAVVLSALVAGFWVSPVEAEAPADPIVPPVIAYKDSGINPYHVTFREPSWTDHPSTFIPGYPKDARPFPITLDADSFEEAWEADRELWDSVEPLQLYYIPGTRIVGAVVVVDSQGNTNQPHFFDNAQNSHGTVTADAGSGSISGSAPNSAIVFVGGAIASYPQRWVASQPWIDILSTSQGCYVVGIPPGIKHHYPVLGWEPDFPGAAESTYLITQQGRMAVNGAGNGAGTNMLCDNMGAPWTMTVGAITGDGSAQYPHFLHTEQWRPAEMSASYVCQCAVTGTFDGTAQAQGTSVSGPRVAGFAARLIAEARQALRDSGGWRDGAFAHAGPGASLPAIGPLADGRLELDELEDVLRRSAVKYPLAPEVWWDVDVPEQHDYYLQGYGGFMETEYAGARAVLLGNEPMPVRPDDDAWHAAFDAAHGMYWEPLSCRVHSEEREPSECWSEPFPRHGSALVESARALCRYSVPLEEGC